jgi:hypothetical protein
MHSASSQLCDPGRNLPPKTGFFRRLSGLCAVMLWAAVVVGGLAWMSRYKSTPGIAANGPAQWPAGSMMRRFEGRPTFVMLLHPHCPCSRASLSELNALMGPLLGRVDAYILFSNDSDSEDIEATDLWKQARRIAGIITLRDDQGSEAERFGAKTSGQTFVYNAEGKLVFSGGITGARGHMGVNAGELAVIEWLTKGVADRARSQVFGCLLQGK